MIHEQNNLVFLLTKLGKNSRDLINSKPILRDVITLIGVLMLTRSPSSIKARVYVTKKMFSYLFYSWETRTLMAGHQYLDGNQLWLQILRGRRLEFRKYWYNCSCSNRVNISIKGYFPIVIGDFFQFPHNINWTKSTVWHNLCLDRQLSKADRRTS